PPPSPTPSPPQPTQPSPTVLPHLTPSGTAHMIPITSKAATHRRATAVGRVHFTTPHPAALIRANTLKKGDALAVARIAAVMAVKRTPELVVLCHPLMVSGVAVDVELFGAEGAEGGRSGGGADGQGDKGHGGVYIKATVECQGPTGVEMEALTAVTVAALNVVDMVKGVDRGAWIGGVRVVEKVGGKSGGWREGVKIEDGEEERQ
ncbi:molybdenum cofactor biosynthesis protein C, partial [Geopyxis carbonaria]